MNNITQDKEIVKNMGKKCKWIGPNGQEYEYEPSLVCGDCEYNTFDLQAVKYEGHEFEAIKDGVKYKSTSVTCYE